MKKHFDKKSNRRTKKLPRALIAAAAFSAAALAALFSVFFIAKYVSAAGDTQREVTSDPATTHEFSSAAEFVNYVTEYADESHLPYHNPNDTIKLAITSGTSINLGTDFPGLGTESRPFNGKIVIESSHSGLFKTNDPLFNYVTTGVTIATSEDVVHELEIFRFRPTPSSPAPAAKPLFANHVVASDDPSKVANWKVTYIADTETDSDNITAFDYSGVFGDIADGGKVNIDFTDNAYYSGNGERANVTAAGDIGVICGAIGVGATSGSELGTQLTVKISGTNYALAGQTISSTSSGNAGGIVGTAGKKSIIKLSDDTTVYQSVITAASGHAGGVCGSGKDVDIDYNGHDLTVGASVSASSTNCAGGLFGYYNSTMQDASTNGGTRVFDLSGFKTTDNFAVAGGRDVGGVIGKLEATNNIEITAGENFPTDPSPDTASEYDRQIKLNAGVNRGGVIGTYTNNAPTDGSDNALKRTLEVHNIRVCGSSNAAGAVTGTDPKQIGGIIGKIFTGNANVANYGNYVSIHDVAVKNTGGSEFSAALVGDMGHQGSFLDVSGRIAATGKYLSGLVQNQNAGVVRIQGYTDFGKGYFSSDTTISNGDKYGQIVGYRGTGLVYALGTGADTLTSNNVSAGWTFRRSGSVSDDCGDWGEVLRLSGTLSGGNGLTEASSSAVEEPTATSPLYFSSTDHTVTLRAHVTSMGTKLDFVKTALNIQHNVIQPANGSLKLPETTYTSAELLRTNLSLSADIDLKTTGITGLTRDNGESGYYTGSFNGNSHTLSLAIGEAYGLEKDGSATAVGDNGDGTIVRHRYQGLFAKTNGATFTNLTIDGYDNTRAEAATAYIGGVTASAKGSLTLSGVTAKQTDNVYGHAALRCGGAVGRYEENSTGTVSITGCEFSPTINDARANGTGDKIFGGAIGCVEATTGSLVFNVGFDYSGENGAVASKPVKLDGTYTKSNDKGGKISYGGLVGEFAAASSASAGSNKRKVNIKNLTVGENFVISAKDMTSEDRGSGVGGFIGGQWVDVDVVIGTEGEQDGVTIGENSDATKRPTIAVLSGSTNGSVGGLFYRATGKMDVNHVDVKEAAISSTVAASTFGFVVNDACYEKDSYSSALCLDVDTDVRSGKSQYYIAPTVITGSNFDTAFDEIAAYSHFKNRQIEENKQAIISITLKTNGTLQPLTMTGSACNTYQNQTDYSKKINPNTRYYYNLKDINAKASLTPAEEMLIWSVYTYAHNSVKPVFAAHGNITLIGGTVNSVSCDMTGLSYYPVDASGITIKEDTTVKFYNAEIEAGEAGTGDSDGSVRSTHGIGTADQSQHCLMHEGIFRNITPTTSGNNALTVNGLTAQGNVSNQNAGYSGFLVCGTFGGDDDNVTKSVINNVVLDGAVISGRRSADYAPLLINKIGKNSRLDITGVRAESGSYDGVISDAATSGHYAASSLIGEVGNNTATNINIKFRNMVLDSRTAALTNGTHDEALTTAYGTSRAIFDSATFFESFKYASGCMAEYIYNYNEDWGSTAHQVTYGKEVSESVEYAEREWNYYDYYGQANHYTSPESNNAAAAYDFSSGFLPHVNASYNLSNYQHEVRVNVKDMNLEVGCGQYNHPYVIKDGGQFETVAKIIFGSPAPNVMIVLPDDLGSGAGSGNGTAMWCEFKNNANHGIKDRIYKYNSATQKFDVQDGSDFPSQSLADVRKYLAGAYYSLSNDITLPGNFTSIGSVTETTGNDYNNPYAFRGVIVGNNYTIVNMSPDPFIRSANGCVVKDLTIQVGNSTTALTIGKEQTSKQSFQYDSMGCGFYGAVIGQVMGGDNIIDHVSVDFTNLSAINLTGNYKRLVPVGGYVGVVVNGGVIFRNMSSASHAGLTNELCNKINDPGWLYVNPIIGRVIAGYAFTESTSYKYSETGTNAVTMKNSVTNGTDTGYIKNYGIPDFQTNPADDPSTPSVDESETNKLKIKMGANTDAAGNHEITVPNAQALHVLSYIVNTGAGSAAYATSTDENAYTNVTGADNQYIGYRDYTQTRCAKYNEVGTNEASSDDYLIVKKETTYNSRVKVPYIIREYTVSKKADGTTNDTMFRARSICGNGDNAAVTAINFESAGDYHLSAGYRGIGSIYYDDNTERLRFNKVIGNNAEITLNMVYQDYNHKSGSKTTVTDIVENYQPFDNAGIGLFNVMYQMSASETNTIKDLTLKGSVFVDYRKLSDGSVPKYAYGWHNYNGLTGYYEDVADRLDAGDNKDLTNVLHTGGIAGRIATSTHITSAALDGLTVEGPKYVGGLIGYSDGVNVTIVSPSASNLTVIGGFCAGGLIGRFSGSTNLSITGTESTDAVIGITKVEVKGYPSCAKMDFSDFDKMFHCAGGLCGWINTGGSGNTLTLQHVKVSGGEITAPHKNQRPKDMRYKIMTGGMIGRLENIALSVSNVSVEDVDIEGSIIGGFAGCSSQYLGGTIDSVTVKATSAKKNISAQNMAGGVFGYHFKGNINLTISNAEVNNYNIQSVTSDGEKASAGGVFADVYFDGTGRYINIKDSVVKECNITRASTYTSKDEFMLGIGGIAGALPGAGKMYGSNILLHNVTLTSTGNRTPGMLVGTNAASNGVVQIAGVSVQGGSKTTYNPVGVGNYGTNGYAVFADFRGFAVPNTGLTQNTTATEGTTELLASEKANYDPASPYVVINPKLPIGSTGFSLSGDGIAADYDNSTIKALITNSGNKPYSISSSHIAPVSTAQTNGKFVTFSSEEGVTVANDVLMLLVDNSIRTESTALINNYINLLANTSGINYASASDASTYKFAVVLKRVNYNPVTGNFSVDDDQDCNLQMNTSENSFYMDVEKIDSGNNCFSLIDVEFLDPAATEKVAYHLYVPVFVKKLMNYEFHVYSGNGTTYDSGWYETERVASDGVRTKSVAVVENLGSPITLYFEWDYKRTKKEWQSLLDSGENLLRNYSKKLNFDKNTAALDNFQNDTILVLVDANNGNKPYYGYFEDVYEPVSGSTTKGRLILENFHESLVPYGMTYQDGNEKFTPVDFNKLLKFTVRKDNDFGKYVRLPNSTGATIEKDGWYYRLATAAELESDADKYSIETDYDTDDVPIEEGYYISFFTKTKKPGVSGEVEDDRIFYYQVSADTSFGDSSYPSKKVMPDNDGTDNVHMITGKIFVQSDMIVTASNNTLEMDKDSNYWLDIQMQSTIKISTDTITFGNSSTSDAYTQVSGLLSDSAISVYHSFITYLTRNEEGSQKKIVSGCQILSSDTCHYSIYRTEDVLTISGEDRIYDFEGHSPITGLDKDYNENGYIMVGEDRQTVGKFDINTTYIEFSEMQDISSVLARGRDKSITIAMETTLKYLGMDALSAQFPTRTSNNDTSTGVSISGSSNIGFDSEKTAVSDAKIEDYDRTNKRYYCKDLKQPLLTYNANRNFTGDEDKLGVNPLDPSALNIDATGTYDISLIEMEADGYTHVYCELKLYRKVDGEYTTDCVINPANSDSYFSALSSPGSVMTGSVRIDDVGLVSLGYASDNKLYRFVFPRGGGNEVLQIDIPTLFTVITGDELEADGHFYSNYKVELTVWMCRNDGSTGGGVWERLDGSRAESYFIYTNAKLIPYFIMPEDN